MRKFLPLIGYLILTIAVAYSIFQVRNLSDDRIDKVNDRAMVIKKRVDTARDRVAVARDKVDKTSRRATRVAKKQDEVIRVLTKAGIQGLPGAKGSVGPAGIAGPPPTNEQIDAAIARFCEATVCVVRPTTDQVLAAVVAFCSNRECRGRNGEDGKDAKVTDEQVDKAISRYCSFGMRCVGSVGPAGAEGPQGPAIASFTFTDATGRAQVCSDPDGDRNYTCAVAS